MANTGGEKIYEVTIPLFFKKTYPDLRDVEKEEDENAIMFCKKVVLFQSMDKKYPTDAAIQQHIKKQNPNSFVEYLVNGEEYDAHWHPEKFEITFKVKSDEDAEEFRRSFSFVSLADAQWESSDDNGWTVKTAPFKKNSFGPIGYEYGLTNFDPKSVKIEVVQPRGGKRKTRKSKRKNRK